MDGSTFSAVLTAIVRKVFSKKEVKIWQYEDRKITNVKCIFSEQKKKVHSFTIDTS